MLFLLTCRHYKGLLLQTWHSHKHMYNINSGFPMPCWNNLVHCCELKCGLYSTDQIRRESPYIHIATYTVAKHLIRYELLYWIMYHLSQYHISPKVINSCNSLYTYKIYYCRERSEWPYSEDNSISYPKGLIRFSNFPRKMRGVGESFGSSRLGAAVWGQPFVCLSFLCFLTNIYEI